MPNELRFNCPRGVTRTYVMVRSLADDRVWQPGTKRWVDWDDQYRDAFIVLMTARGGGVFRGDFPTEIPPGEEVTVRYFIQHGDAPNLEDAANEGSYVWDGQNLISLSKVNLPKPKTQPRHRRKTRNRPLTGKQVGPSSSTGSMTATRLEPPRKWASAARPFVNTWILVTVSSGSSGPQKQPRPKSFPRTCAVKRLFQRTEGKA